MNKKIQELTIDGEVYVPKSSISNKNIIGPKKIVVLQRGWVYIGDFEKDADGVCRLYNASCIRVWGTTRGLSELVYGPTSKTILEKCDGVVEFDWLTVVHTITVDQTLWLGK